MIDRYSVPEMAAIWDRQHRFDLMMKVEMALVTAWGRLGEIPLASVHNIRNKMTFSLERVDELEKITDHDVVSFVNSLGESVGDDACYIHKGATSSDILDTATSMQIVESGKLLLSDIDAFLVVLRDKAKEHKRTPMMGRTHGVHAEPMTFGLKVLSWYAEIKRDRKRVEDAVEVNRVGNMSGAVGTYANLHPDLEMIMCEELGLEPDVISTQVVARDRHAQYMLSLAQLGATIDRIGRTLRLLQRTETGEVEEAFKKGQTGSSAMPHKKNPKTSEQLCGLSRILRANAMTALENNALWDERDISHSSVERIVFPDSSILASYITRKMTSIISGLVVNADRMKKNMEQTGGAVFSGRLLVALMSRGLARDAAYKIVQRLAIPASKGEKPLKDGAKEDAEVRSYLGEAEIDALFDLDYYLRYVDSIFIRNLEEA
ncbi:MAG TPA: adenylosuccinate lyase [Caldisericia bacterium]|nr:adenylosuccinate lyase [Caldisericia bacterium]HPF48638.1 adenylosuccinate lyase [Caldisericia bacterium]HPI83702.1 adenylosuccinate lyase [Caldisericia bacterium]HPQ93093.1 adenylosuccinate lyase [Caldisericia bacterium]HRV75074.1 adenylosuccinate lyase [Caldisericia bacterium]